MRSGSLGMSVPTGQYDSTKLVNIGMNRYSFTPEVGVSKAIGPWTLELAGGPPVSGAGFDAPGRRAQPRARAR